MENSSSSSGGNRNTIQISPAKHWCFTLNNPTLPLDADKIILNPKVKNYVFQEEVGDSGTHHLQGYIEFTSKIRPKNVIVGINPHWEKCRAIDASKAYCSDEGKRMPGGLIWENCLPEKIIDYLEGKPYYAWQQKVVNLLKTDVDPRKVVWIWESNGNVGKTSFIRHLILKQKPTPATYVTGKSADVKYALIQMKQVPKTVLVGFTRSQENFISYQMLEEVKDGLFFSSKYEAGMKVFNPPHLIIMANFPPDMSKLSVDRWNIYKIVELDLVECMDSASLNFP